LFENEDIDGVGKMLHRSWEKKKKISPLISSVEINSMYDVFLKNGVMGGKLLGSGGAGFFYLILNDTASKEEFINKMKQLHFQNVNFKINGDMYDSHPTRSY